MQIVVVLVRELEHPEKVCRRGLEDRVVGDIQPVVFDNEAVRALDRFHGVGNASAAQAAHHAGKSPSPGFLHVLFFQRRANDAGQVADILGDEESSVS